MCEFVHKKCFGVCNYVCLCVSTIVCVCVFVDDLGGEGDPTVNADRGGRIW